MVNFLKIRNMVKDIISLHKLSLKKRLKNVYFKMCKAHYAWCAGLKWLVEYYIELPRSVGAQYATGDRWRNNSRKNEETEPKQNQHPVVDVTGDRSKV